MPDPSNHLRGCGVPEVEVVDEGGNSKWARGPLRILVAPFGRLPEEGNVA